MRLSYNRRKVMQKDLWMAFVDPEKASDIQFLVKAGGPVSNEIFGCRWILLFNLLYLNLKAINFHCRHKHGPYRWH